MKRRTKRASRVKRTTRSRTAGNAVNTNKLLALAILVAGGVFGLMGGEYNTFHWWQLRGQVQEERAAIGRLEAETDSLAALADALENDPFTQERVAREAFGMLRPGETLYRVDVEKP